jgi:hypothetical protein
MATGLQVPQVKRPIVQSASSCEFDNTVLTSKHPHKFNQIRTAIDFLNP